MDWNVPMAGGYQPRTHMEHLLPITKDKQTAMDGRSQPRASMELHLLLPWTRRCHWQQITAQDAERHRVSITTDQKVPMANRPQLRTHKDISFPLPQTRRYQRPEKAQPRTSLDTMFLILRVTTCQVIDRGKDCLLPWTRMCLRHQITAQAGYTGTLTYHHHG